MMSTKLLFILCICTKKGSQHKEHLSPTRQEKTQSKNTFLFQDPWFLNDDKIEKEEGKLQDPWLWNDDNIQKEEGKKADSEANMSFLEKFLQKKPNSSMPLRSFLMKSNFEEREKMKSLPKKDDVKNANKSTINLIHKFDIGKRSNTQSNVLLYNKEYILWCSVFLLFIINVFWFICRCYSARKKKMDRNKRENFYETIKKEEKGLPQGGRSEEQLRMRREINTNIEELPFPRPPPSPLTDRTIYEMMKGDNVKSEIQQYIQKD